MSLAWQIMLKMVLISQTLTNLILSANENAWFQLFDQWESWKFALLYLFEDQKLIREHHYLQATRYWTNMNILKSILTLISTIRVGKNLQKKVATKSLKTPLSLNLIRSLSLAPAEAHLSFELVFCEFDKIIILYQAGQKINKQICGRFVQFILSILLYFDILKTSVHYKLWCLNKDILTLFCEGVDSPW